MNYPDWANDHADEFEAAKEQMQELAVDLLSKKTYTFVEEFVDELFDAMRKEHEAWEYYIMQPKEVVLTDTEKFGLRVELEADDEGAPAPPMTLSLSEVVPAKVDGRDPFVGILLPFQPREYTCCRFFKDHNGVIFDVPERTYSLQTAVNCAGFWMTSEHNWDTNAMNIIRRAYWCISGNDPLGKIFAIAMKHSNASPTVKHWDNGHWSLDPDHTHADYDKIDEFSLSRCWRDPDYHLESLSCQLDSCTSVFEEQHYWTIYLDALTMSVDELMDTHYHTSGWYSRLSIVDMPHEFTREVVEKDYAKLRAVLKQSDVFPFRELLDYVFDGKWLE